MLNTDRCWHQNPGPEYSLPRHRLISNASRVIGFDIWQAYSVGPLDVCFPSEPESHLRRVCLLWCGNEELHRALAQSIAGSSDAVVNWVPCFLVGISGVLAADFRHRALNPLC